jgi:hypothetical protein
MRNACAHSFRPINFATRELANVCKRVTADDRYDIVPTDKTKPEHEALGLRLRFMLTCLIAMAAITGGPGAADGIVPAILKWVDARRNGNDQGIQWPET